MTRYLLLLALLPGCGLTQLGDDLKARLDAFEVGQSGKADEIAADLDALKPAIAENRPATPAELRAALLEGGRELAYSAAADAAARVGPTVASALLEGLPVAAAPKVVEVVRDEYANWLTGVATLAAALLAWWAKSRGRQRDKAVVAGVENLEQAMTSLNALPGGHNLIEAVKEKARAVNTEMGIEALVRKALGKEKT